MKRLELRLVCTVLLTVCLSLLPVGYQMNALNVPQHIIESFVNRSYTLEHGHSMTKGELTSLWSFLVAIQSVGAPFGCLLSVPLVDKIGRKPTLIIVNNFLSILGNCLMAISKRTNIFELLIVGRLILGLSGGLVFSSLPLFLSEISPPQYLGMLSCLQHIILVLGLGLAAFLGMDFALGSEDLWCYLFLLPIALALLQFALYTCFPESPKFAFLIRNDEKAAGEAITFYYGKDALIDEVLKYFSWEAKREAGQLTLRKALKHARYRTAIFLGILVNIAQLFTGMMSLSAYSTNLATSIGLSQSQSQVFTAAFTTSFAALSLPALYLVEKCGRRPLFLSTLLVIVLADFSFLAFGLVLDKDPSATWATGCFIVTFLIFTLAYNMGPGPLAYFMAGELAPQPIRSAALAIGTTTNWTASVVTLFVFYPLKAAVGSYSFLLFAIPSLLCLIVLFLKLPETKPSLSLSASFYRLPESDVSYGTFE